jgi:hypothetical protein
MTLSFLAALIAFGGIGVPPIDAAGWRKPFERCGLGDSW